MDSEIADHEMCIQLFRVVSFPRKRNYALKQTAVEKSNCHENDVAAAIMKNFYVDALLKSVEHE